MMIERIPSASRGGGDHGWLKTRHTFSFADYYDPARMHFGHLRVINEDRVAPGKGFGTHAHRDMEILTYVISGAIEHRDSMGNGAVVPAGDVQRMSAGTGVLHSEFNPSAEDVLHFLQIWVLPDTKNLEPGYEQTHFSREEKLNTLRLIASRDGRDASVTMHQDVDLYASFLEAGRQVVLDNVRERRIFVQVVSGELDINGEALAAGDGVKISAADSIEITASSDTEFLLFNLS
jgi:redox-sensitive bicupin YhaK (pirin superfamily)